MQVKKAVIPAGGLGTRLLPLTKAVPKEMLPLGKIPAIQHIVEEAAASGIEDILIVTSRGKDALENYFDRDPLLEASLLQAEKQEELAAVRRPAELAHIHYIRQQEPRGLGDAVLCARSFVGEESFAVLLPDDVIFSMWEPCLQQLLKVFGEYGKAVVALEEVDALQVGRYGIVSPGRQLEERLWEMEDLVEKPRAKDAPSRLAVIGRYVLPAAIFSLLQETRPGAGGEVQLTDALKALNSRQSILGLRYEGRRYDVGDWEGYLHALKTL